MMRSPFIHIPPCFRIAQIQIRLPGNINLSSQVTLGGGFASVTSMQGFSPDWAEASLVAALAGGGVGLEAVISALR